MVRTTRRVVKNDDDIDNRSRAGSKGRRPGSREGTRESKDGSRGSRASRTRMRRRSKSRDGSKGSRVRRTKSRSKTKSGTKPKMSGRIVKKPNVVATKARAKATKTPARVVKEAKVVKEEKVVKEDKVMKAGSATESHDTVDTGDTADVKSTESEDIKTRFDNHSERLAELDHQIDVLRRERRKVFRQMIKAHSSDIKKAEKKKRTGRRGGFVQKKNPVGGGLAKFLGVEDGSEFTAPELTSKFWAVMRSKNLVSKDDGRVFKVSKEVQDVFGVPTSAKRSKTFNDPHGFNFTTYQRYISNAQRNNNGKYGENNK
jgi:hypothetical protein